jgi:ribonuclease HI
VSTVSLFFDGACEPNPGGLATFGAVLDGPGLSAHLSGVAAEGPGATNNVAEWCGLEKGLEYLATHKPPGVTNLVIRGDSQLVVKQLSGEWGCHKPHLAAARDRCLALLSALGLDWLVEWVPRDQNAEADQLTMEAWVARTGGPFPEKPQWHKKRK